MGDRQRQRLLACSDLEGSDEALAFPAERIEHRRPADLVRKQNAVRVKPKTEVPGRRAPGALGRAPVKLSPDPGHLDQAITGRTEREESPRPSGPEGAGVR